MRSVTREDFVAALDAIDTAMTDVLDLSCEALTTPEYLAMLERCEVLRRRLPALEHAMLNQLATQADQAELGGTLSFALAERLRITRAEASRRIGEAADLGPRHTLTGEPLEPVLPATAAGQRAGVLGSGQVAVIRQFWKHLPDDVDIETRMTAEAHLAGLGAQFRPDQLAKLADRLTDCVNPDGNFTDADRARRRTLRLGKQHPDGMSPITGWLTPEARATFDAVLAKLAAPGMCNPDHDTPTVDGPPSQEAIESDTRSAGQRNHDAINAALRSLLASGDLGQHNGLPASIIATTTLAELEAAAGTALTAGGTLLPMSDVIRLASHAHHYLAIFHQGKALALYHTKRLASPGQRIVLYAKDRGCTHPGCTVPGYLTEVHHHQPYAHTGETDIGGLTLRCGPHHQIITTGGWTTRPRHDGTTQTIPPPHLDHGQPRINNFHHPERILRDDDDGDGSDDDPPD